MALTGKTNAEKIWNYCIKSGLNEFGTAGLMGNLWAESGLEPIERPADMSTSVQLKRASYGQNYYTEFVTNKQIGGVENMGYLTTSKGKKVHEI